MYNDYDYDYDYDYLSNTISIQHYIIIKKNDKLIDSYSLI